MVHGNSTDAGAAEARRRLLRYKALGEVANITVRIQALEAERKLKCELAAVHGANNNQLAHACHISRGKADRLFPPRDTTT